ncbi:MAG: U32 family peptidase [Lachnospiraceae bacterium]
MKKVELLAPAGNYEAFLGAVHAGADAIYLGGTKYSARAFADNFDEETLCRAISYAHLFGRKVYLTMNTLVKQSELKEVYSFLRPFYLEGLDGVIVQDMGLMSYIKRCFPLLEIHISTQMAITGAYGVRELKKLGASRIVPARELSLQEIMEIKKEGLEVETFVHGAMCYCYSGQCFFSSLLGGRSGNRGKCAQSCRLPYEVKLSHEKEEKKQKGKKEEYPLSLKDMCSLHLLPQLIEGGIDSFKIEGRMKRPEYAAGVTAIYRKYIDLYYETGCRELSVEAGDWEQLKKLYIRSEIQEGYYFRQNSPEMVTMDKPGYLGTDDQLAEEIKGRYIDQELRAEVVGNAVVKKGEPLTLNLFYKDIQITCKGAVAQQASKRPLSREDVEKQLKKTGNTPFIFQRLEITMEEDCFLPLKAFNEIRREAFSLLERELNAKVREERREALKKTAAKLSEEPDGLKEDITSRKGEREKRLLLTLSSPEQCLAACRTSVENLLFVASHLLLDEQDKTEEALREFASKGGRVWIRLPEVLRRKDYGLIDKLLSRFSDFATGMMISNLETYGYLLHKRYGGELALDHHLYLWNRESLNFWKDKSLIFTAPLEINRGEWKELKHRGFAYLCYGRIPMMVTANCIRKTKLHCRDKGVTMEERLKDRYKAEFPVQVNCDYCYNIIYNSVPLSLHGYLEEIGLLPGGYLRLDFTTESQEETERIIHTYENFLSGKKYDFSFLKEYTTGHYKKGAL